MRIPLLRRMIEHIRQKPGVWFATGHQVATQWAAQND
ncbi:Uncharacterised protein [Mycobacterium tuberculosis]|nr:Uncharacterised protein [Mycobacterium tuberculosis]